MGKKEEQITDIIVKAIESGDDSFQMPWHSISCPNNAVRKKPYRGINTIVLWAEAFERGYTSSFWASYRDWQSLDRQVRKGEKATPVTFFSVIENEEKETQKGFRKFFSVFNADQLEKTDEAEPEVVSQVSDQQAKETILNLAKTVNAEVTVEGDRAFYSHDLDKVWMPDYQYFVDTESTSKDVSFSSVLAHELVHWTGHRSRLDRPQEGKKTPGYAFEELIAELGSAFVCSHLNFEYSGVANHAGYIKSWLKVLKKDPKAIFKASAKASEATRYLLPELA